MEVVLDSTTCFFCLVLCGLKIEILLTGSKMLNCFFVTSPLLLNSWIQRCDILPRWQYLKLEICMYVCLICMKKREKESIFKKLGSLFKLFFFSQWGSFIAWCSMFNPLFRCYLFRTFSLPLHLFSCQKKGPLDQGQVSFQILLSLWNF